MEGGDRCGDGIYISIYEMDHALVSIHSGYWFLSIA